jgi:ABC-2 type transport system ATP-binding protein
MGSVEELCDNITLINKAKTILEGSVDEIRKQWAGNEFEITFEGDVELAGNHLFTILKKENENNKSTFRFRTTGNINTNDILMVAVKSGNIISFNPALPSMNEIFIRVVEARN